MYHILGKLQDNRLMCAGLDIVTTCITVCPWKIVLPAQKKKCQSCFWNVINPDTVQCTVVPTLQRTYFLSPQARCYPKTWSLSPTFMFAQYSNLQHNNMNHHHHQSYLSSYTNS